MFWLLVACWSPSPTAMPATPVPLPEASAFERVRPLDGAQRLFGGPFRCVLPDGTDVSFHPNGIARGEPAFRGSWRHEAGVLTVEARHDGVEIIYDWPYIAYARNSDWMLATPTGALSCRPGHEAEPGPGGSWIQVFHAGGPAPEAGRALTDAPDLALVVDANSAPEQDGVMLFHREGLPAMRLAQHLADRLAVPVTTATAPDQAAPYLLVVGR
jgi:hypothetical protein